MSLQLVALLVLLAGAPSAPDPASAPSAPAAAQPSAADPVPAPSAPAAVPPATPDPAAAPSAPPDAAARPSAPDPAYLGELLAKAARLKLAKDRGWLRLGHYRRRLFGGWLSETDGRSFFLSPRGKVDPAAELEATLEGFFRTGPFENELDDPQCRFPARFAFLASRLGVDATRLPRRRCPNLEEWFGKLAPRSVTLVFSSYYLSSAASVFGHTFLRVNKAEAAREGRAFELLDYVVDYSATVDTKNPVLYALKGLLGMFPGRFNNYAYYYKVREYADAESRDLWEYDLALTPEEVVLLVAHIWELGHTYFEYWYIDENCSYHVIGALEAAAPRLELLRHVGRFLTVPADTVKALFRNPGLVRAVHYRPSIRTQFAARTAGMDGPALAMVEVLSTKPAASFAPSLPDEERVAALDAAADLIDLRSFRALAVGAVPAVARARQALLERRAEMRVPSPELVIRPPAENAPERGHGSSRVGLGGGWSSSGGAFGLLDLRVLMHDLADRTDAYPERAQLEFLAFRLRATPSRAELDEAWLVSGASLTSVSRFDQRSSWRFRAGAATIRDGGCSGCLAGLGELGAGFAFTAFPRVLDFYAGVDGALEASRGLSGTDGRAVRAGIGPGGIARLRLGSRATLLADGRLRWLPAASPDLTFDLRGTFRLHVLPNLSLSVDVRRTPASNDATATVLAYF